MSSEQSSAKTGSDHTSRLALTALVVLRLTLAFWVGAAVLFVITSVAEQVFPQFNSTIRDQLSTIRFPYYYMTGTACCTVALAAGVLCRSLSSRLTVSLVVVALASGVYAYDYFYVYRPLQELIIPPGQPRTDEFDELHEWSRNVNMVHLILILFAGVHAAIPLPRSSERDNG